MRGFSRLAALFCVIYYVIGLCISRGSCGTNGEGSSGEPESNTSFIRCNPRDGGSRRRGRWYQRFFGCFRPESDSSLPERRTPQRLTQERPTSERDVRFSRSHVTFGQKSIAALSRLRNEYTPSCSVEQQSLLSTDFTTGWACWEAATPVGVPFRYKVVHPTQTQSKTWTFELTYPVIAHPGCVIVEVTKKKYNDGNSLSGKWLLEIYPVAVPDTAQNDVMQSMRTDLVPFLTRGLQFYKLPNASLLLSRLRVLLPVAVLERESPVQCATEPPTTLARVSVLRWRTVGTLEDFINSLYEKHVLYRNVTTRNGLAGLLSITEQVITLVGRLHKQGFVIGDLTADKFVVGEAGIIYLDGMKHLKQAMNLAVPERYDDLLQSPPEVSSGQAMSFSVLTDTWQVGLLLLQLWCGGFRSSNESLWGMRHSRTMVSYFQVRAGLASHIDFSECAGQTIGEVRYIISSFLKRGDRVTPSEMMDSEACVYIREVIA